MPLQGVRFLLENKHLEYLYWLTPLLGDRILDHLRQKKERRRRGRWCVVNEDVANDKTWNKDTTIKEQNLTTSCATFIRYLPAGLISGPDASFFSNAPQKLFAPLNQLHIK